MSKKIAFIGHRDCLPRDIELRLKNAIQNEINNGCKTFTMGTHGDFDKKALCVCSNYKKEYKYLQIEVVITSLHQIEPIKQYDGLYEDIYYPYEDVNTIMYDIEEVYFKKRITVSNFKMIDSCDTLICYARPQKKLSGAKIAMNYARKNNKRIINLFKEDDDI